MLRVSDTQPKNGTISTPWYGEDFVEAYYEEDRDIHMVLELPDDIKEQVGSGLLVIELEVDTREERCWGKLCPVASCDGAQDCGGDG